MANKAEYSFISMAAEFVSEYSNDQIRPSVSTFGTRIPERNLAAVSFRIERMQHHFAQTVIPADHIVRVRIEIEDLTAAEGEVQLNAVNSRESAIAFLNKYYPNWREAAI